MEGRESFVSPDTLSSGRGALGGDEISGVLSQVLSGMPFGYIQVPNSDTIGVWGRDRLLSASLTSLTDDPDTKNALPLSYNTEKCNKKEFKNTG